MYSLMSDSAKCRDEKYSRVEERTMRYKLVREGVSEVTFEQDK